MQNDPRYYGGQGSHYAGYDGAATNYYDSGSYYPSSYNNPPSYAGGGGGGGGSFFDYDYNGYGAGATAPPSFGTNGVELQASDNCPNNFLIFDHTDNRSRIMYNPAFGQGGYGNYQPSSYQYPDPIPAPPPPAPPVQHHVPVEDYRTAWRDDSRGKSSLKDDDSDDIDALLSLEDEDNDEDDVLSTGRTPSCKYRCSNSPDSTCSTGGSKSVSVSQKDYVEEGSSGGSSPVVPGKKKKKDRMKKMVKVLRGIVPGGQQMDTPAVLDEAVKYLKSLKVEAKKLGFRS